MAVGGVVEGWELRRELGVVVEVRVDVVGEDVEGFGA